MGTVEFRVRSIDVVGNEYFGKAAITKVMLTKTKRLFRKGVFDENLFNGDIEAIKNLYVYEGFIDVGVESDVQYDSSNIQVDITIRITEGKQYFVRDIVFRGISIYASDSLSQKLKMEPGAIFDPRQMTADNYIIRYLYDDLGYADVQVESDYRVDETKVFVTHTIEEGEKQYVGGIEIVGLRNTDTSVVLRELDLSYGSVFRYARILESQRELYKLGVFRAIRTEVNDSEKPDHKDIRFLLTERELMTINWRVGYGTRDQFRTLVGLTHNNIIGQAWQGKLEGKLSFAEQRASASMTVPRSILFGSKFGIGIYFKRLNEIGYVTQSFGGDIVSWYELGANEFSAKYRVENIRTYFEESDSTERGLLHGFIVGWLRDQRDDPFNTTRGSYLGANLEMSGVVLPSDVDYVRPTLQLRFFRPFMGVILAAAFRTGMVEAVAPTVSIPVYRRFYCGGTSSVRGYPERGIGPVDENDNPLGGRFLCEISGEVRFPIYKILGGVAFVDGGNIWQEMEEIDTKLRWGVGGGLRLQTFLGSVRLDYGFKLGRQEEESLGVLHFAIGEAF